MVIYNGLQRYHRTRAPQIIPSFDFRNGLNHCERTLSVRLVYSRLVEDFENRHSPPQYRNCGRHLDDCCAFHNMLLHVDGLSDGWKDGVPSHWESESGEFDEFDVPASIQKLIDPNGINRRAICTYDTIYCG
jgi:hypothetical protein